MPTLPKSPQNAVQPHLEYHPVQGAPSRQIVLEPLPFLLGRSGTANFVIYSPQVSKDHAEIHLVDYQFRIRDLQSTNGTFVNGQRIQDAPLANDDIVHVANEEFRFVVGSDAARLDGSATEVSPEQIPISFIRSSQFLQELLTHHQVRMLYQPIVRLDAHRQLLGYEALARGTHSELSVKPLELLRLADQCGQAAALSLLFRQVALTESVLLPDGEYLFLNLHPSEIGVGSCFETLIELQAALASNRRMVLEFSEHAVADLATLRSLCAQLHALGVLIAYDDFGAGQARFMELAEVPPDFIKLDMKLIRGIDFAEARHGLILALNCASADLGVQIIAEGIETPAEAEVCRQLGCHYGQGYHFGPPQATALLVNRRLSTRRIDASQVRSLVKTYAAAINRRGPAPD